MQGEEFFRCGGHNANRCGIIQAHKGEQAFGVSLVAVAVDDNDLTAFFGDLVKTLALGKAADAGNKFIKRGKDTRDFSHGRNCPFTFFL